MENVNSIEQCPEEEHARGGQREQYIKPNVSQLVCHGHGFVASTSCGTC